MKVETQDLTQGTPEWHAHRREHFNASEAPAMMGDSPWQSREELLFEKKTGIAREVNDHLQRVFDRGHEVEAIARPILEESLGEELYPETCSTEIQGLKLSASLDGVTLDDETIFECKQWNKEDAAIYSEPDAKLLPKHYWQVEQQLLVKGAKRCIFVMTDGEDWIQIEYKPVRGRAKKLIAGWKQFAADLEAYVPVETEKTAELIAYEAPTLPAIEIKVNALIESSNFDAFNQRAHQFLESIKFDLESDQDFADAEVNVKACKKAEDAIKDSLERVKRGSVEISELVDMVESLGERIRQTRLSLDKAVTAEKTRRKREIIQEHQALLTQHVIELNADLNGFEIDDSFLDPTRGLKTLKSIREKCAGALATAKAEANRLAELAHDNYSAIPAAAVHLFEDWPYIADKAHDDFVRLVNERISAEAARQDAKSAQEAAQAPQDDEISVSGTTDAPETLKTQTRASDGSFVSWWQSIGSWAEAAPGEDVEDYVYRVAKMAWNAAKNRGE